MSVSVPFPASKYRCHDLPKALIDKAWEAQIRLYRRYQRHNEPSRVAVRVEPTGYFVGGH